MIYFGGFIIILAAFALGVWFVRVYDDIKKKDI